MNPENQNKTLQAWQTAAPYWDKYRLLIAEMFAPLTSGLIEEAHIQSGHKVLDIGGGSGEPSLTISGVVGPTGSVMYTDPVADMVQSAQAEADRTGLTNIQFTKCSADDLPFDDNSFDVAVGRLSAMFFADPLAGIREARRVITAHGSLSFVVWSVEEVNPFFSTVNDAVDRFIESPDEDPDAPDAFRFAVPGKLAKILETAGAENVVEHKLNFHIEAPISLEQFWQLRTEMSQVLREKLRDLPADQIQAIKQEVIAAARQYFVDNKMSFPAQALIVSGRALR